MLRVGVVLREWGRRLPVPRACDAIARTSHYPHIRPPPRTRHGTELLSYGSFTEARLGTEKVGTSLPFSCFSTFVSYAGYFCRAAAAAGPACKPLQALCLGHFLAPLVVGHKGDD